MRHSFITAFLGPPPDHSQDGLIKKNNRPGLEKHLRRKDVENGIHCHQLPGMETQEVTLEVMFRAAFKKLLLLVTKTEWKGKCDT